MMVSNGRWAFAIAAWLAPIPLLTFARSQPALRGLAIIALSSIAVFAITWRGMIPLDGAAYFGLAAGFGFATALPYIADRLVTPSLGAIAQTFVFPATAVAVEFLLARTSPYGTWGSVAYTQSWTPLLQIASVTGMLGVTFLVSWCASTAAGALRLGAAKPFVVAAVVAAFVIGGGAVRARNNGDRTTVRVAMIQRDGDTDARTWRSLWKAPSPALIDTLRNVHRADHATLLARSRAAAKAGANLIVWSELAALTFSSDKQSLLDSAQAIAREHNVHMAITPAVFTPGESSMQNELIVIDPLGKAVTTYRKGRPVPGDPESGGDAAPRVVETAFGRAGLAICFDMDFPDFVRVIGKQAASLMLVPSRDWRDIEIVHAAMARMRAVENGAALVRPTSEGVSLATDAYGNEYARASSFAGVAPFTMAEVPVGEVNTLYARFGDWFAFGCVLLVAGLIVRARLFGAKP